MTDKRADEREIAKWLGAVEPCTDCEIGKLCIHGNGRIFIGAKTRREDDLGGLFWCEWSPSTDANLWPEIMEKVYEDMDLLGRFGDCLSSLLIERGHRISCPYGPLAALKEGPEAWTRALAQAIRAVGTSSSTCVEMKEADDE